MLVCETGVYCWEEIGGLVSCKEEDDTNAWTFC